MSSKIFAVLSSFALVASGVHAADVYVFSTGNNAVDSAYAAALTGQGHTPTIGVPWSAFDGSVNLAAFDVVFMNHSANWGSSNQQVSVAGQQQLVNFVNNGGGLITTEWIIYNNGTSGGVAYATLMPILPATYANTWNSIAQTTFSQVTPDPIINAGLPASFLVDNDNFAGRETGLRARPGATVFYQSSNLSSGTFVNAGLSGWQVGNGRVISISNMPGLTSLTNDNYERLIGNAVNWVIPSPGAIAVLGLAGVLAGRRRR